MIRRTVLFIAYLLFFSTTAPAQVDESKVYKQYSANTFVEILKPYQTGDFSVGIQSKGRVANVITDFGQLGQFHVFAPSINWPAWGEGAKDEQHYGWGVDFMMGYRGDVLESFQDPASNIISRDWRRADENLFSGNVTVSESDLTPIMATSDNKETWPLDSYGNPFWPGIWRQDRDGAYHPGEFTSERDLYTVFTDEGNHTQYGLRVEQTAYSFTRRYAEDFLIFRFNIKNTGNAVLDSLFPGMMLQFLIDFDNHDMINFIDSDDDGEKDLVYMWDTDLTPRPPWIKVGYIGLLLVTSPENNGVTNFHFFHDDFIPSKDEDFWRLLTSDTTGLPDTLKARYFHGDNVHIDDVSYAPDLDPEGLGRGGEITWTFSTGPVSLAPGDSMPMEIAIILGDDEADLLENVQWVHKLAKNNWNGSNPPSSPVLSAYPGDGKVTLVWDASAEESVDNISGEKDFEGYKVYRSTDRGKSWGKVITDPHGQFVGYVPLAQYDLDNDVSGYDPISNMYLGNNSGLRHTFVDSNVSNGVEYWYTVTAYDRGDPLNLVEALESAKGLTPDEVNVVAVRPETPPANLIPGAIEGSERLEPEEGRTDATAAVEIIDPARLKTRRYEITFEENTPIYEGKAVVDSATTFTLKDADSGDTLLYRQRLSDESGDNIPVVDGFRLVLTDVKPGKVITEWTKVAADTCTFYWSVKPTGPNDITVTNFDPRYRFKIVIDENPQGGLTARYYDLWFEVPHDSTIHLPLKIYVDDGETTIDISDNTFLGEFIGSPYGRFSAIGWDLIPGGKAYTPGFPYPDRIMMYYYTPDNDTMEVRLVTDHRPSDTPPSDGDEFTIRKMQPFYEGLVYRFSMKGASFAPESGEDMQHIRAVPNPFFVSSSFKNKIMFTHLPERCEIRLFNVAGDLIRTLQHSDGSGVTFWDLKNDEGLAVAYGLYVFVVKTPDGQKFTGKLAVVR